MTCFRQLTLGKVLFCHTYVDSQWGKTHLHQNGIHTCVNSVILSFVSVRMLSRIQETTRMRGATFASFAPLTLCLVTLGQNTQGHECPPAAAMTAARPSLC